MEIVYHMPTPLPTINLSAATVGASYTLDLTPTAPNSNPSLLMQTGILQLYNESAVGLRASGANTDLAFDLPAGAWKDVPISPAETSVTFVVLYVMPNPAVSSLIPTYYAPNEAAGVGTTLGNSPVNVGNTILVANQVSQTGQPDPTFVVAATPSASFVGASLEALLNNDGSFHFGNVNVIAGLAVYADNNGNLNVHTLSVFVGATLGGPITLASGIQETGYGAIDVTATAGAQTFGAGINFKMVMTNTPSSITITSIANSNTTGAPVINHIDQYGFEANVTSSAAGRMFYIFTYTTVGN